MIRDNIIYLDNNATTPLDPRVLDEMMPFLTSNFANASSTHQFGLGAYEAVKVARRRVADLIKAESNEVIFTSGATEAINLAIKGVAESYSEKGKHIISVKTEHSAVLDTCKFLESRGYEVTYLSTDEYGLIDLNELKKSLTSNTILVAVMFVNNETGVIQPIKEIAELAHQYGAFFFTDATQAAGKIEINVDDLNIDLLSISAHKFHGPKGIGSLFVRQRSLQRVKIQALLHGGGHERGLRSGTLNVPGIVGLGKASDLARVELKRNELSVRKLRDHLEFGLLKINNTSINGSKEKRLYNVTNICFDGADSDAIIMGLSSPEDGLPIAVSNGSACTSSSIEPSHVLTAMGFSESHAFNSIRFSLSTVNSKEQIDVVISKVAKIVESLRAMIL
jgi:cysteine desulfurase